MVLIPQEALNTENETVMMYTVTQSRIPYIWNSTLFFVMSKDELSIQDSYHTVRAKFWIQISEELYNLQEMCMSSLNHKKTIKENC